MKYTRVLLTVLFLALSQMTASAAYMNPLPSGTIKNMYIQYLDSDSITITSGYCDAYKEYYELTADTNYDLVSIPAGTDFVYIYIDISASTGSTPTFTNSTTEPTWQDDLQGWYNAEDRCIGAVYIESGSILEFTGFGTKVVYVGGDVRIIVDVDPTVTGWTSVDTTAHFPVNAIGALMYGYVLADIDKYAQIVYRENGDTYGQLHTIGLGRSSLIGWMEFRKEGTRDIDYYSLAETSTIKGRIYGYNIDR